MNRLYEEGCERIHKEFSAEKIIRSIREVKLYLEAEDKLNENTRVAVLTFPEMIIDLDDLNKENNKKSNNILKKDILNKFKRIWTQKNIL